MIQLIIIYFLILTLDAIYQKKLIDWKSTTTEKIVQYSNQWHILYATIFSLHIVTAVYIVPTQSIKPFTLICLVLWMRWVWFEGLLNLLRGMNWFYIGSGNIDNFIKHYSKIIKFNPEFVLLILKLIILLIITIINHYESHHKIY